MKKPIDAPADNSAMIQALSSFDTATLFESAEQPNCLDPVVRPLDMGYRIAGPALTVACPAGDNLMLHVALAEARPGEVLVVQCHDATFGVWGEVLMTQAIARGVAGLVIDGAVRDIDAMRAARFPVFARAVSMRGAAKRRRGVVRQPVSCAGVLVWPGDIVVADDSGVLVVGAAEVSGMLARAAERQEKEVQLMGGLRDRATTLELLALQPAVAALGL